MMKKILLILMLFMLSIGIVNAGTFSESNGVLLWDNNQMCVAEQYNWTIRNNNGYFNIYLNSNSATPVIQSTIDEEFNVKSIKSDGSGKVVCIKSDGNLGTCSDQPAANSTCSCS